MKKQVKSIPSARNVYICGFIGAILIILAEILPWHSGYIGFELIWLQSFTYSFPLFGGIFVLVGAIIGLLAPKRQIAPVLFQFSGLSLVLLFLLDYLQINWEFLDNAQTGFYSLIVGIAIVFLEIIAALMVKLPPSSDN